jgi:hypothetical protein
MVIGPRGIGKTFGLRYQCIKDFLKDGSRFVEVVRFKAELSGVSDGYFNRLQEMPDFKDYIFKTDARYAYIAKAPEDVEDEEKKKPKPEWKLIAYFIALSDAQRMKKRTFDKVRRIIFDESILEHFDRYHNYLPNEFGVLANLVDTVSRERADTAGIRPRVYLLGNACDLSNPYFAHYSVGTDLKFGYRWYSGKTFLLHYVEGGEYSKEKLTGTVAGRMMAGTEAAKIAIDNAFVGVSNEFVKKKPSRAKFNFGIICNGKRFGIWVDIQGGLYYVTNTMPRNTEKPIFALTVEDNKVNYIAARSANQTLAYFKEMYYLNLVRYQTLQVKRDFIEEILVKFGIA